MYAGRHYPARSLISCEQSNACSISRMTLRTSWITRAERPEDAPTIRDINRAAFPGDDEANLVDALRTDPAWLDGLSIVSTTESGTIVGHALLTRCHIGNVPALCLAPCAVLPEYQNKGAGTAAINFALKAAKEKEETFVVVLGHPDYYPRFGFERASMHGIRLSIDVPDDALMALSLDPSQPLPTGIVKYAPPFGI